ncbi:hypothetical protein GVAV_001261 [Gurleya vavrai]
MNKLKKLCEYRKETIPIMLKRAVKAVNLSYHSVLKTSPYIFRFGMQPVLEIDKDLNPEIIQYDRIGLKDNRDKNFEKYADKNIKKGKKLCFSDYNIGDTVLIYKSNIGNKFDSNWFGHYKVVAKIHDDAFLLKNLEKGTD